MSEPKGEPCSPPWCPQNPCEGSCSFHTGSLRRAQALGSLQLQMDISARNGLCQVPSHTTNTPPPPQAVVNGLAGWGWGQGMWWGFGSAQLLGLSV